LIRLGLVWRAIQLVHDIHAGDDQSERRKAVGIEAAVVAEVDEDLRETRLRASFSRECDKAADVFLSDRLVAEKRPLPRALDLRIAVQSKLGHEPRADAEEARSVVKAVLHKVVKPVRRKRGPLAVRLDDEHSFARVESHPDNRRRRFRQGRRIGEPLRLSWRRRRGC